MQLPLALRDDFLHWKSMGQTSCARHWVTHSKKIIKQILHLVLNKYGCIEFES